jgi:hypothetical protein
VSTPDFHRGDIHQAGHKSGSVGQAVPGVAIRAVDQYGNPVAAEVSGRLQALKASRAGWQETGERGHVDEAGFVWLEAENSASFASVR